MAEETKVTQTKKFDLTKLNNLAVVSLATAVTGFGAVAGVITGHVALAQIKKSGEAGRPLALAGVIVGYAFLVFGVGMTIAGYFLRARGYGEIVPMGRLDQGFTGHMDFDGNGGMMQFDPNQVMPTPSPSTN